MNAPCTCDLCRELGKRNEALQFLGKRWVLAKEITRIPIMKVQTVSAAMWAEPDMPVKPRLKLRIVK